MLRRPSGTAFLLPNSALRLPRATRDALGALSELGAQLRAIDDQVELLVIDSRRGGASWAHVGTCLGVTAETARLRYKALAEDA